MVFSRSSPVGIASVTLLLALGGCGTVAGDSANSQHDSPPGPTQEGEQAPRATHHSYVTRPDLTPPRVSLTKGPAADEVGSADDYIFLSPRSDHASPLTGRMIVDVEGEPVWIQPASRDAQSARNYDFRPQQHDGQAVLTWYEGLGDGGHGAGSFIMADSSYEEVATITTGGDIDAEMADFHDSTITSAGTMLVPGYIEREADLSDVGGPSDGWVYDGLIQEIDIDSGEIIFEWHSLDHIPLSHTEADFDKAKEEAEEDDEEAGTEEAPFDYFHINSITEDDDGSLLVSARNTHAVYQLERSSGDVNWILGGEASDFELGDGVYFAWQHDAARQADGTLTLFDNQADPLIGEQSRGLRLKLDTETMTAEVDTEYLPPRHRVAGSMGSFQELDDGRVLVGWGAQPYYSEYTSDGELIYDAWLRVQGNYRAYRAAWQGEPTTSPDVVINREEATPTAYVSWNGATEVAQWRLLAGEDEADAAEVATVDHDGFETAMVVPEDPEYVAVEGLDEDGEVLGSAPAVDLADLEVSGTQ